MFTACAASIRLAIALVCVGAGLIIGGIWLNLIPNETDLEHLQRQRKCQHIGLTCAALIRDGHWEGLARVLQLMVDDDPDLLGVEIDTEQRQLFVIDSLSVQAKIAGPSDSDRAAALEMSDLPIAVTLKLDGVVHGTAQFHHRRPVSLGWLILAQHPLIRLLAFFIVAGVCVYTVFVDRIMKGFEVTQMVPDRIRQSFDTLSEGLLVVDENERIILANRSFSNTVGISKHALLGRRAGSLPWVCSESTTVDDFPWVRAIKESQPRTEQLMRYRLPDGSYRFFSINASPIESHKSKLCGALATFRDVTDFEKHRAEQEHMLAVLRNSRDEISSKNRELEILATQDALTGCLNRRALFAELESLWRQARQQESTLACVMVDNDHFKRVNDLYGHQVGDEVIKAVARILDEHFLRPALVCRYGGEEFCIILPETTMQEASEMAEEARLAIEAVRLDQPADLRITASMGISDLRFGATEPQELINQADKCLYVAKANGRNQIVLYCDAIGKQSVANMAAREDESYAAAEATGLPFQAVTALVSALEYRDSETAEHSRRVADLCVRLASGVLDQRDTYLLEIAALLHDIGKLGVPDDVLLKPGPLTSDEWKTMRRHDRIAVEIASSTFNSNELSEIIRCHRAYYGGRRQDAHLPAGNDIPLAARLLFIADSYDSMVSDRVYRQGRTHEAAIDELRRCAGTQFDPVLVEHFAATISGESFSGGQAQDVIPKPTAMQIGLQIERLADALESRDVDGLQTLASRLSAMARHHRLESIAMAAEQIEADAAEENMQWMNLLRDTQLLLNLCRTTQNVFLADDAEQQ